jgi:hypothetical protein
MLELMPGREWSPITCSFYTSYIPHVMPRVNYFLHFKNSQDLKVLGFFAKLYTRISGLVATPDPRVMFIILIITLNLG